MKSIVLNAPDGGEVTKEQWQQALEAALEGRTLSKVLLLPPDLTRYHSRCGELTNWLYHRLSPACRVDIMPALGTHAPMTGDELSNMFGDIPHDAFLVHDFRNGCMKLGTVPGKFISEVSGGRLDYDIEVQVNKAVFDGYDLILSLGQVIPHEVAGMANHAKNIFVGVGGIHMINRTHFLGAVCGMEAALGNDHAPVRQIFDYAAERFLKNLPIVYAMTVVRAESGRDVLKGVYIGEKRDAFEAAVAQSRRENINWMAEPLRTAVCYMEPQEFRSFWLSNKAIYRTRMAMADCGKLIVLAPGVEKFGEDAEMDATIRRFGYHGTDYVLQAVKDNPALAHNLSAAAHLIHGSSECRFEIYYAAPKMSREEVENAGFIYLPWEEAMARYGGLKEGFNTIGGEQVFYNPNPAMGLWRLGNDNS